MARITEEESELREIEEQAAEHLAEEGLAAVEAIPEEEAERPAAIPRLRFSLAAAFSTLAAAVMVGGVFKGAFAYFMAALAGILGVVIGGLASRTRRVSLLYVIVVLGLFGVGLISVLSTGNTADLFNVGARAAEAATSGDVLRPPVPFTAGWRAISGWLMAGIGFASAWTALEVRRPSLAMLVPMPVAAVGAISVPKGAQLVSGLVSLVLFAFALGILSGSQLGGEEEGQRLSMGYELRRGARGLLMLGVLTTGLYFLGRLNILFPSPIFDPAQEAQRPKTVALSEVEDRVLFTVEAEFTGPWRMGLLDVYDGRDWRLPPFAENKLSEVPVSGIVDSELTPGVRANFEIKGLGGAVLPGLPNTAGIVAAGPRLAYDSRTGNIRLAQGQIEAGLQYTVVAARIPTIDELRQIQGTLPRGVERFLEMPAPPPAVEDLLRQAPTTSAWDRLDFVRQTFLKAVVAEGAGTPVSVPPSKVQDMLVGSKKGSPFEIVAGQAMLARWAGVPARIGYGFDGGEKVGKLLEVRPKHGAAFIEVYFPGFKWLPVVGTPLQAASTLGGAPKQQAEGILPSDDIAIPILIPIALDPATYFFDQVRRVVAILVPIIVVLLLIYYIWPAMRKAIIRARRRTWAAREGPVARIAVAYAEWRDVATDFGYRNESDTPLMFLDRVTEDDEHAELAWLVTRILWGDLHRSATEDDASAAEELSRSLRKRLAQAHSYTLRAVAAVSRLSLKYAYAPALAAAARRKVETRKAA